MQAQVISLATRTDITNEIDGTPELACIIAAAPELLEVVELLLTGEDMASGTIEFSNAIAHEIFDKARAAVAKAKGEA